MAQGEAVPFSGKSFSRKALGIFMAAVFAAALFLTVISAKAAAFFAVFMLFAGTLFTGINSVRCLLLYWLLAFTAMLFYGVVLAERLMLTGANGSLLGSLAVTAGTTILWCISIGISEHDVGKLVAGIINTMTTCILIALSVLGAYSAAGAELQILPPQAAELLQLVCLNAVLPFVIAGYTAALFKEMQIYVEKKYMTEEPFKKGV